MTEEWRPVVGFEGSYEVSDLGRVRSCDRLVRDKNGMMRAFKGRVLKHGFHSFGYPQVMLGRRTARRVYTLVAEAFLGPKPAGCQVLHRDGDVINSRKDNLRYGTAKENQADLFVHGTACIGASHPMHKVTAEQVEEIRKRCANGEMQRVVGASFGLTQPAVSMIVNRKNWK